MPLKLLILFLITCICSCSHRPSEPSGNPETLRAEHSRLIHSPRAALRHYRKKIAASEGVEKTAFQILAAETLYTLKKYNALETQLNDIDSDNITGLDQVRLMCLHANLLLVKRQFTHAVKSLPQNKFSYPVELQQTILSTQAQVLYAAGYRIDGIYALARLHPVLQTQAAQLSNARQITYELSKLPQSTLEQLLNKQMSHDMNAWLAFTLAMKADFFSVSEFDQSVHQWQQKYPYHKIPVPLIAMLRTAVANKSDYPEKIALLLPLTGTLKQEAISVRDGFLSAYYQYQGGDKPEIKVIDTTYHDSKQIVETLEQLYQQGVDLVVGPLTKTGLNAVQTAKERPPLTVLALNYNDTETVTEYRDHPLFQFGLLPEDEAIQAAKFALQRNQTRAIIMVPNSKLGARMASAFKNHYQRYGGYALKVQTYPNDTKDFSAPIKNMLNIQHSLNRKSLLQTVLNRKIAFEPRVRKDVDVIYLIAEPNQARSIKPQLKFYEAGDIPILANSQVYQGQANSKLDRDINGLVFTHTPWVLENNRQPLYRELDTIWPQQLLQYPNLYALGVDSFKLIPHLSRMQANADLYLDGNTGRLRLDSHQRIQRELLWARFKDGLVTLEDMSNFNDNEHNPEHVIKADSESQR